MFILNQKLSKRFIYQMISLIWFRYGEVCLIAVIRFDSNHMYMYIIHYVHFYHPLCTCLSSIIYLYIIHYVAFDLTGRQNYPAWSLFSPLEGGGQSEIRKWQQSLRYPHREHHGVLHRWLRQLQRSRNLSQRLWVRETTDSFSLTNVVKSQPSQKCRTHTVEL